PPLSPYTTLFRSPGRPAAAPHADEIPGGPVGKGRDLRGPAARVPAGTRRGLPAARTAESHPVRRLRAQCAQRGLSGAARTVRGIRGKGGKDEGRYARNSRGTHRTVGRLFVRR